MPISALFVCVDVLTRTTDIIKYGTPYSSNVQFSPYPNTFEGQNVDYLEHIHHITIILYGS